MEAERAGSVSNCQSFLLPFPCTFNLYLTLIPSSPTTPSSSHFLIYKPPFNLQQLSTMHTKSAMFTSLLFLALILLPTIITAAQLPRTSSRNQLANYCKFPGSEFFRHGFTRDNIQMVPDLTPNTLEEWKTCMTGVEKKLITKRVRRLRKMFVDSDRFEKVIEMTGCARDDVLKIFNTKLTLEEAIKAQSCFETAYERPNLDFISRNTVKGLVRYDEDCELAKENKINGLVKSIQTSFWITEISGALWFFTGAVTPIGAVAAGLFAFSARHAALETASLNAALEIKCPDCSDMAFRQIKNKVSNEEYQRRFIKEYSHFHE